MDKSSLFWESLWAMEDDRNLHIWGMLTERSQKAIVGELADRFLDMPVEDDGKRFYWLFYNMVEYSQPVQTLSIFSPPVRQEIIRSFLKAIPEKYVRV